MKFLQRNLGRLGRSHLVNVERGGKVRSPFWNTKRLSKDKLREHLEETRLIDELCWASPAGSLEDTVRVARRTVVAVCVYWWNAELSVLRRKFLTAWRRFTRSKGDPLLCEAWKKAKSALSRQDRSSCVGRREELFTLEELKRAGGSLKANTSPGIDGVPNEILKEVNRFNSCLREGRIFVDWKKQRLVLLRKGNKPFEDA